MILAFTNSVYLSLSLSDLAGGAPAEEKKDDKKAEKDEESEEDDDMVRMHNIFHLF